MKHTYKEKYIDTTRDNLCLHGDEICIERTPVATLNTDGNPKALHELIYWINNKKRSREIYHMMLIENQEDEIIMQDRVDSEFKSLSRYLSSTYRNDLRLKDLVKDFEEFISKMEGL